MLDTLAQESAMMNTDFTLFPEEQTNGTEKKKEGKVKRSDPTITLTGETPVPLSPVRRESQHIPLASLYIQKDAYTIPDFQREYVWPSDYQALFIRTVLYGFPCDPIKVIRHLDGHGALYQYIIDGQQRFTTLMRFMHNDFKTPTIERLAHISPNSKIPPLEPGRFYKELSAPLRSRVNAYALEFIFMENVPESWWPDIFNDWQNHLNLGLGHQLWARSNVTADLAKLLADYHRNPFWSIVFKKPTGKNKDVASDPNRVRYLCSLVALALETTGSPWTVDLRKDGIKRWGSGVHDSKVTAEVFSTVHTRLEGIAQVFAGADVHTKLDMILLYQAACYLEEQEGYNLVYSQRGCLVEWYSQMRNLRRVAGKRAFSPVSFLGEPYEQRKFWEEQLPILLLRAEQVGLVKASQVDEAFVAEMATSGAW